MAKCSVTVGDVTVSIEDNDMSGIECVQTAERVASDMSAGRSSGGGGGGGSKSRSNKGIEQILTDLDEVVKKLRAQLIGM